MHLKHRIQKFLKQKLTSNKMKLRDLSRQSGIPYDTLAPLHQGFKNNPELRTIMRIADHFNVSLDEATGRKSKYFRSTKSNQIFQPLEVNEVNSNLKQFLLQVMKERNLAPTTLSIKVGFSSGLISDFLREDRSLQSLGTASVVALADYFDTSIDQMIGRTTPAIANPIELL